MVEWQSFGSAFFYSIFGKTCKVAVVGLNFAAVDRVGGMREHRNAIRRSGIMSTRSSIWLAEDDGKSIHLYWELAEREMKDGRSIAAPIFIAVDKGNSNEQVAVRLPKEVAEALLTVLCPNYLDQFGLKVC